MLNIITLPFSRYPELLALPSITALPSENSIVVVAEDAETHEIKALWAAVALVHIEPCVLTGEAQDSGLTAIKMLMELLARLAEQGVGQFYAFADREDVVNYLLRLGLSPLPYAIFTGLNPNLLPSAKE